MREWVACSLSSTRGTELWIDLWDRASQIDYELAKYSNVEDQLAFLASNDIMEMHLRRLASKKYLARTGDRSGAQHMLALQAPGQQSDAAPTWMVAESTAHSKAEHRRAERVRAQPRDDDEDKGAQGGGAAPQV